MTADAPKWIDDRNAWATIVDLGQLRSMYQEIVDATGWNIAVWDAGQGRIIASAAAGEDNDAWLRRAASYRRRAQSLDRKSVV